MSPKEKSSKPSSDDVKQMLTVAEVAEFLRMKPNTLAIMRCRGDGPPYIKTGIILYARSDLEEWISKRRQTFTAQEPSPELSNQKLRKIN